MTCVLVICINHLWSFCVVFLFSFSLNQQNVCTKQKPSFYCSVFDVNVSKADSLGCNLCQICIYLGIVTFLIVVDLKMFSHSSHSSRSERRICIRICNGWMERLRRCKMEFCKLKMRKKNVLKYFFLELARKWQMIKFKFYNDLIP